MSEKTQMTVIAPMETLEEMFRRIVREEIKDLTAPDEIGGVELAERITGWTRDTIYKKARAREIPFRQEIKGGKMTFSRNELMGCLKKRKSRVEVSLR